MRVLYRPALLCLLSLLAISACSGAPNSPAPLDEPHDIQNEFRSIELRPIVASYEFDKPVGLVHRTDRPEFVHIIEQPGRIQSVNIDEPGDKPSLVLDLTDRVHHDGNEQGLLGLAYHPERPTEAYVNYTTATHTVIARYEAYPDRPELLDPESEQVLLAFEQPYPNHNGGQLAFGPDGYLYIASGDGGSGGDPHNNSQNLQSLLGKILRIDVDRTQDGRTYAIPGDNPFIGEGAPEIYAYGLRNPWRFSFDAATGMLWVADVGQQRFEEINIVERGGNYGWRIQEGDACYDPAEGCNTQGLEQPVYSYGRELGVSITGGYLYRGDELPELAGWYVYADYGTGTVWALKEQDGEVRNKTLLQADMNITSFGTDASGEMYLCTIDGRVMRLK
jgi:glucose/arabinose dehydrogenase